MSDNIKQAIQDSMYEFPYHYLPSLKEGKVFRLHRHLWWGLDYLTYMSFTVELIRSSEKKTPETFYLTVEQVRKAACAWLQAQALPYSARKTIYQHAAETITYYQQHNQKSRTSHWKKTLRKLRKLGIRISHLKSCVPSEI